MQWIAPSEKDTANGSLEKKLWDAADQFRANSGLKSQEYSAPVLGLIFLRFADVRFAARRAKLEKSSASARRGSRVDDPTAYHAEGVLYLPPAARFDALLSFPEGGRTVKNAAGRDEHQSLGHAVNDAMRLIEADNPQLAGVLPKTYQIFDATLLKNLLKKVSEIPATVEYDAFGRIYEYFLGEFARTEGQKGGEFYTPACIVRLLTEVIEPYHGLILDPACGSGGMFVQSARFVSEHHKNPASELSIYGHEKVGETARLCRMNLAIHGLEGDIKEAITYYEDPHRATGRFDFVLANPPFNVNAVDKDRLKDSVGFDKNGAPRRYPFGLPRTDNANYLWIQLFYSALNEKGRAGFVMANSASDARASEQEIRQKLIESRAVDVMVAVGPNMFYTVTLPCTLWFLDRGKAGSNPEQGKAASKGSIDRRDTVLFIDARHIYRQLDRAHRDWTPAQIGFLANIVRLYRGEELDFTLGGEEARTKLEEVFKVERAVPSALSGERMAAEPPAKYGSKQSKSISSQLSALSYTDIPGLCRAASIKEIEAQGWSLNPGRYVGVAPGESVSDEDFKEQLETLNEELEVLNAEARELEEKIASNLQHAALVLVVEGPGDEVCLRALLPHFSAVLGNALAKGSVAFYVLAGGTNLPYALSLLHSSLCNYHVFLDDDQAGRKGYSDAARALLASAANTTLTRCPELPEAEFEDLLNPDVYAAHFAAKYSVDVKHRPFKGKQKWSSRIRSGLATCGKVSPSGEVWPESDEYADKCAIAGLVAQNPAAAIHPSREDLFRSFVTTLEQRLAALSGATSKPHSSTVHLRPAARAGLARKVAHGLAAAPPRNEMDGFPAPAPAAVSDMAGSDSTTAADRAESFPVPAPPTEIA